MSGPVLLAAAFTTGAAWFGGCGSGPTGDAGGPPDVDAGSDAAPECLQADGAVAGCPCATGSAPQACYTGPPLTRAVGRCADGAQYCLDERWSTCGGESQPREESCDGADDDCDGEVDEGVQNACGDCDGQCAAFGPEPGATPFTPELPLIVTDDGRLTLEPGTEGPVAFRLVVEGGGMCFTQFRELAVEADVPEGASVSIRARTAQHPSELEAGDVGWQDVLSLPPGTSPVALDMYVEGSRAALQLEVTLEAPAPAEPPVLESLRVRFESMCY